MKRYWGENISIYRMRKLKKKLAVVKTTGTIGLWNIFHKKLMITSIAEFSHSNRTTAFSHD
jgi:hypothetical protein